MSDEQESFFDRDQPFDVLRVALGYWLEFREDFKTHVRSGKSPEDQWRLREDYVRDTLDALNDLRALVSELVAAAELGGELDQELKERAEKLLRENPG